MRLFEIAEKVEGALVLGNHDKNMEINGVCPIKSAKLDCITFLISKEFSDLAKDVQAGAIIVSQEIEGCASPQIIHKNPYYAFAIVSQIFVKEEVEQIGISERSFVHPNAILEEEVTLFPGAYVSAKAKIGRGVILYPGAYIGTGAQIGDYTIVRANSVIEHGCVVGEHCIIHASSVIGGDGFGFAPGEKSIAKIPQTGIVKVGDHVEIGPLTTVDRGTMDPTVIGNGTKIDSKVHIAHNCIVGDHSLLCGGAMMAGSSTLGDWCTLAGQVAIANKVKVADRITVAAKAGVTKNLTEPGVYGGYPAIPLKEWRRDVANIRGIAKLKAKIKELTQK